MPVKALVRFSNPDNHSGVPWRERIPPKWKSRVARIETYHASILIQVSGSPVCLKTARIHVHVGSHNHCKLVHVLPELIRANMNAAPGSATVYIFAKHIVLTLPFWVRLDCLVFQTFRWNHMSSLKTCCVFPTVVIFSLGYLATIYFHWVEFLPTSKLILGGVGKW